MGGIVMPNYNRVILAGHLVRDPELRFSRNDKAFCNVPLAVSERFKDKEDTLFIDVTFFGRSAELLEEYCAKGSSILVEGRLQQDRWEDKDGQKRSKICVVADRFQFLQVKQRESARHDSNVASDDDSIPF